MLLHCSSSLAKSLRQNFDQLDQNVAFSLCWAVECSIAEVLNQHPMLDVVGDLIEKFKRELSYVSFL